METMTVIEALGVVIQKLGNIAVPRVLNDQIGVPIDDCADIVRACIEALNHPESDAKQEDEKAEETSGDGELQNGNE